LIRSGGGATPADTYKIKISSDDTPEFLGSKLVAGSGVTITETEVNGVKKILIEANGGASQDMVYFLSDVDNTTFEDVVYIGKLDKSGYWLIMRIDYTVEPNEYRYASGYLDYGSNWSNRINLTYGLFEDLS
jgi:hypothetical protein